MGRALSLDGLRYGATPINDPFNGIGTSQLQGAAVMCLFSTALSRFSSSSKDVGVYMHASDSKACSNSKATSVMSGAEGGVSAADVHVKEGDATIVENSSDRAVVEGHDGPLELLTHFVKKDLSEAHHKLGRILEGFF